MMFPPYTQNKNSGFTLIELVVVMLLISIILAVAIPRFDGGFLQDPTKKTARWLITTVKTLRSKAIQEQQLQTLVIDLQNNRMWTFGEGMDEDTVAAAEDHAFVLPDSIRIVDLSFPHEKHTISGNVNVNFYPAGFSDSVLLRLEDTKAKRFSFLIEPLLPKVKYFDEWISD